MGTTNTLSFYNLDGFYCWAVLPPSVNYSCCLVFYASSLHVGNINHQGRLLNTFPATRTANISPVKSSLQLFATMQYVFRDFLYLCCMLITSSARLAMLSKGNQVMTVEEWICGWHWLCCHEVVSEVQKTSVISVFWRK